MDHNGSHTPDGSRFGGTGFAPEPEPAAGERVNITKLMSGILDDVSTLFKQQMTMLRAEIKQDVIRSVSAAKFIMAGAFLTALGSFFLLLGLVPLLGWLVPSLPEWACWGIVGGTMFLVGGLSSFLGYRRLKNFNPLPEKTYQALQENIACLTNHPN
ncbi:phage holin family protein [Zavarzinella formosa]|uniref:phage holin family protein n=1 Tax=Zavarzinella formosa TaxID=360055 RepID=UPI0003071EC9|nr:phage holin family protein [Zavarzinella formosa]